MKLFFGLLILGLGMLLGAQELPVSFDLNRLMDENGNTVCEISYRVLNKDMTFSEYEDGSIAAVIQVTYSFVKDDKAVKTDSFEKIALAHDYGETKSANLFMLDKMSFTISKSLYSLQVQVVDRDSGRGALWVTPLNTLDADTKISDIELCQGFFDDPDSPLHSLKRGDWVYYPNPSHIINRKQQQMLNLYYQVYPKQEGEYKEKLFIGKEDAPEHEFTDSYDVTGPIFEVRRSIPLAGLSDGFYNLRLEITTPDGTVESRDWFSLVTPVEKTIRLFANLDDSFALVGYFIKGERDVWEALSDEGRINYMQSFYAKLEDGRLKAYNNKLSVEGLKKRIKEANDLYATPFKEGWKTDRGRIYIRHGKPDDEVTGETDSSTKYTMRDWVVWRYRVGDSRTYVFIDYQKDKNFRIIYADEDPFEQSAYNWQSVLGEDFDTTLLQ